MRDRKLLLDRIRQLNEELREKEKEIEMNEEMKNLRSDLQEMDLTNIISDPATPAGQKVGAILVIKQQTKSAWDNSILVGDCIELVELDCSRHCSVKSLRHGTTARIGWKSFFPLNAVGKCWCGVWHEAKRDCHCIVSTSS